MATIRVADFIAQRLAEHGIKHVFMVTGGGAMHLNDAFGREKRMDVVCCHHEQTCAMAAESYYRMSGRMAAVNVTTGPGGTNTLTGIYGAYVDSLATIVVSGQVKWETLVASTGMPLRQLGDQEIDIISVVKPVTKYAVMVTDPQSIRYHLEKALYLAEQGRPGPVWLDIPINVQATLIDPTTLKAFDPKSEASSEAPRSNVPEAVKHVMAKLQSAKRPVLMVGTGVRIGKAYPELQKLIDHLKIPVVTAWNGHDLVANDNPYYCGRPGIIGDRAGNFVVQNSDFLLVVGNRLNIRQVSYNWDSFARAAYKVIVDIDPWELKKPTLKPDYPVCADAKDFIAELLKQPRGEVSAAHKEWVDWGKARVKRYPTVLPEYWKTENVNPYCFVDTLFSQLKENEHVVTGDGTACVVTFQAAKIRKGQRLYTNSGCASMGYDLPAAIGAWMADPKERIICLAGDGSIQMNLQDLATIAFKKIPAKIFVLYNKGYHSIRQTQQSYFPDNVVGCGEESGLGFPDFGKLASAYGIPHRRCANHAELAAAIKETIGSAGPQICEIVLDLEQGFAPKLASKKLPDGKMVSSPLEDMAPFLSREEFLENMIIPPMS
ncbi:MAG: thiamine pyrophosphate-binding protein [Bdellovibrionales bacterium]|nr:thiamine pyrophosphate-binding protein [Bdellovibrionales bacterium]